VEEEKEEIDLVGCDDGNGVVVQRTLRRLSGRRRLPAEKGSVRMTSSTTPRFLKMADSSGEHFRIVPM